MEWEWPIWKICFTNKISLNEVRWKWTLSDIFKALDYMEMENDYEAASNQYTENTFKPKGLHS